jgi:hypothetical protein
MDDGARKSYPSPVLKWQLRLRWIIMRIVGPMAIVAGILRLFGWL